MEKHSAAQEVGREQNRLCSFLGSRLIGFSQQYDRIGGLEGEKVRSRFEQGEERTELQMKRREFLENISFFLHGLHCFLPPSFYILFVLPLFLLTSQVIAWDCSAPKSLSVCTLSFSLTKIFFRKREDTAVYTVHECRDLALTLLTSEAKGISRHCFP